MNSIFEVNLLGLYFLYGLSFYTMGLAIALQYRSYSSFRLAYSLSFLAAFGLFHGLSEWGSLFVPVQVPNLVQLPPWKLIAIQRLLQAVSHFFLFLFGAKLISDTLRRKSSWFFLPVVAMLIWLVHFAGFIPLIETKQLVDWLVTSESWSRYLLAFPGGLLTAFGLALQFPEVKKINDKTVTRNLWGAVAAFSLFAVFSGLIVPKSIGVLGIGFETVRFQEIIGLPVEVFRTCTAFIITYCITRMLAVFDLEKQRQLDSSLKVQTVLKERERFARDLHDDVIQAIYGEGINLQTASKFIKKDPEAAVQKVDTSIRRLNRVIHDLRSYIHDLEKGEEEELQDLLRTVIKKAEQESDLYIDFICNGPGLNHADVKQAPSWKKQIQQILREALNNVAQHADADHVKVMLENDGYYLRLEVRDNGKGYYNSQDKDGGSEHRGINNMRARAELLKGQLEISSTDLGTRLLLSIPLKDDEWMSNVPAKQYS